MRHDGSAAAGSVVVYLDRAAHVVKPYVLRALGHFTRHQMHLDFFSRSTSRQQLASIFESFRAGPPLTVVFDAESEEESGRSDGLRLLLGSLGAADVPHAKLIASTADRVEAEALIAAYGCAGQNGVHRHVLWLVLPPRGEPSWIGRETARQGAALLVAALVSKSASRMAPAGGFDLFASNPHVGLTMGAAVPIVNWKAQSIAELSNALLTVAFEDVPARADHVRLLADCRAAIAAIEPPIGRLSDPGSPGWLLATREYRDRVLPQTVSALGRCSQDAETFFELVMALVDGIKKESAMLTTMLLDIATEIRNSAGRQRSAANPVTDVVAMARPDILRLTRDLVRQGPGPLLWLLPERLQPTLVTGERARFRKTVEAVEGLIKAAVRSAIHRERTDILTRWPSDASGYSADAPFVFMPGELETESSRDSRDELWPLTDRAAVFTFRDVT
jgi:hypothetical protein